MATRRLMAFLRALPLIEAIERRGMIADVVEVALEQPQTIRVALLWELLTEIRARASHAGPTGSIFHGVRILPLTNGTAQEQWQDADDCVPHEAMSVALHRGILDLLAAYCRERPTATLDAQSSHDALLAPEAAAQFVEYFLGDPRTCTPCAGRTLAFVTDHAMRERCLTRCLHEARERLRRTPRSIPFYSNDVWRVALWCLAQLPRSDDARTETLRILREDPLATAKYRDQPAHYSVIALIDDVDPSPSDYSH